MTKSGDDYVARLYVIFSVGFLPWQVKAVNYVWASHMKKYDVWENAFAGKNAIMVALRNKDDRSLIWQYEKRNVYEDLQEHFGTEILTIDAVAIMTDTDNSGGFAEAYYGDIFFSSEQPSDQDNSEVFLNKLFPSLLTKNKFMYVQHSVAFHIRHPWNVINFHFTLQFKTEVPSIQAEAN